METRAGRNAGEEAHVDPDQCQNPSPLIQGGGSIGNAASSLISHGHSLWFGCSLTTRRRLKRIYLLKRSEKTAFSFICADLKDISLYASIELCLQDHKRFLPGLTLLSWKDPACPKIIAYQTQDRSESVCQQPILPGDGEELGHPSSRPAPCFPGRGALRTRRTSTAWENRSTCDRRRIWSPALQLIDLTGEIPKSCAGEKGDVSLFE